MKHRSLLLLSSIFFLALFAMAGHRSTALAPTLTVSCPVCLPGEAIIFQGSGYKSGAHVEVSIQGPVSYTIITTVESNGNIYVDYGTSLSYDPGSYHVTASAMSGKSLTPLASQSFTVQ
jgi:hypothetical protein